jgi:HEAT repeat protein
LLLIERLRRGDKFERQAAAESLGRLGDPRALSPLTTALKDPEKGVREAAVSAIGRLGGGARAQAPAHAAADTLGARVCAWDGWLPPEAARQRIRAERPLDTAREAELRRTLLTSAGKRRDEAARALASGRDSATITALISVARDTNEVVRDGVLRSLGTIGSARALPVLNAALRDGSKHDRQAAAWALGQIASPLAVPALLDATHDANEHVRTDAMWALGMTGDTSALPRLRRLSLTVDEAVRVASACASGWLRGAPEPRLLSDSSRIVRGAARWAQWRASSR